MQGMTETKGVIFNIQRFSLHDGKGIRTVLFLKGCPLACRWCSNPESISGKVDIFQDLTKCIGCGLCQKACPEDAIYFDKKQNTYIINREKCTNCGLCAEACPTTAITSIGQIRTVTQAVAMIKRDLPFFTNSGGGVTLSGGEILFQPAFAFEILKTCKEDGIDTAIETSGNGKWKWLSQIATVANTIYYDLKAMDAELHRQLTTVNNDKIIKNLIALDRLIGEMSVAQRPQLIIRIPMIEGRNVTESNIKETADFFKTNLTFYDHLELLPFHNFGESKYRQLGKTYEFAGVANMGEENYSRYLERFNQLGIKTNVMTW